MSLVLFRLGARIASTNDRAKRNQTPRRRQSCENRPSFVPLSSLARRGVWGSASPFLTRNLHPPTRRGIVRNSSTSWLNHRCLGGAGRAGPSAFLGRPCFATGYFRFAPIAHILRTIQRDGRDGQSAAPCGHFARPLATASRLGLRPRATRRLRRGRISLVRSTFGLRGFPPLRFCASRWWWARGGDAEAVVKLCTRVVVAASERQLCRGRTRTLSAANLPRDFCLSGSLTFQISHFKSQISDLKSRISNVISAREPWTPVGRADC